MVFGCGSRHDSVLLMSASIPSHPNVCQCASWEASTQSSGYSPSCDHYMLVQSSTYIHTLDIHFVCLPSPIHKHFSVWLFLRRSIAICNFLGGRSMYIHMYSFFAFFPRFLLGCRACHPTGRGTWTPQHDVTRTRKPAVRQRCHTTSPACRTKMLGERPFGMPKYGSCFFPAGVEARGRGGCPRLFLWCFARGGGGGMQRYSGVAGLGQNRTTPYTWPPFAHCTTRYTGALERMRGALLLACCCSSIPASDLHLTASCVAGWLASWVTVSSHRRRDQSDARLVSVSWSFF